MITKARLTHLKQLKVESIHILREVAAEFSNPLMMYSVGKEANIYNVGGKNERTNLQIVDAICTIVDEKVSKEKSYKELMTFVEDRAGHDRRYAVDATKIESELGWKTDYFFYTGILKTIDWYLRKYNNE